jgi:hypothetical protein
MAIDMMKALRAASVCVWLLWSSGVVEARGWFGTVSALTPAQVAEYFTTQQIDNPLNPLYSYNNGIAALQQKKYMQAEKHFSLAADLYAPGDAGLIPVHCSWGDAVATQLLEQLQAQAELKDAALDAAIAKASEAGAQYEAVLGIDPQHAPARERKKIVDRLRALLEQRKKQEEDKKEEQKQQNQKNNQQEQENSQQNKENSQQEQDGQSGSQQQDSGQQKKQDKKQKSDQPQKSDQKKDAPGQNSPSDAQDDAGQKQDEQDAVQENQQDQQDQKDDAGKESEQERPGQEQEQPAQAPSEPQESQSANAGGAEQKDEQTAEGTESAYGEASSEQAETSGEEQKEGVTPVPQYDANADMAKKRGLVLLDKLQQNEAALQKAQLLRQSAVKQRENKGYNQW